MTAITRQRVGKYELTRVVGAGGMSTVYEALDTHDWRTVALKLITVPPSQALAQQKQILARLKREIRAITAVSHPNIVTIHDVGEGETEHFIAMEYLNGTTLSHRMATQPLSLSEIAEIVDQTADALDAVHCAGVVHRDVKPANIMVLPGNRVKLMDFGVARDINDTMVTQTGQLIGSPSHMSPEQIRGMPATSASDIWSLGVVLYEMLAGYAPFAADNIPAVLYKITHENPPPVPGAANKVRKVLSRALNRNAAHRYECARDLAEAFRAAIATAPAPVRIAPLPALKGELTLRSEPLQPTTRCFDGDAGVRFPPLAWGALGLLLLVSVGLGSIRAWTSPPVAKASSQAIPPATPVTLAAPALAPRTERVEVSVKSSQQKQHRQHGKKRSRRDSNPQQPT